MVYSKSLDNMWCPQITLWVNGKYENSWNRKLYIFFNGDIFELGT